MTVYMCDDCNVFPKEPREINGVLCCPGCLNPVRIPDEADTDGWRDPEESSQTILTGHMKDDS